MGRKDMESRVNLDQVKKDLVKDSSENENDSSENPENPNDIPFSPDIGLSDRQDDRQEPGASIKKENNQESKVNNNENNDNSFDDEPCLYSDNDKDYKIKIAKILIFLGIGLVVLFFLLRACSEKDRINPIQVQAPQTQKIETKKHDYQAEIARLKREIRGLKIELERYEALYGQKVEDANKEEHKLDMDRMRREFEEAKAKINYYKNMYEAEMKKYKMFFKKAQEVRKQLDKIKREVDILEAEKQKENEELKKYKEFYDKYSRFIEQQKRIYTFRTQIIRTQIPN